MDLLAGAVSGQRDSRGIRFNEVSEVSLPTDKMGHRIVGTDAKHKRLKTRV